MKIKPRNANDTRELTHLQASSTHFHDESCAIAMTELGQTIKIVITVYLGWILGNKNIPNIGELRCHMFR